MDFTLTKEQKDIRTAAMEFAAGEIAEHSREWDELAGTPDEVIQEATDLGFVGMTLSEDLDGAGFGIMEECLVIEAFSSVSAGAARTILEPGWGVEFLPSKALPSTLTGVVKGGSKLGLLVPDGSLGATTEPLPAGGKFEMVTSHGDVYLLFAVREGEEGFFVVPSQTPGLIITPLLEKLGLRAWAAADIILDGINIQDLAFVPCRNGRVRARAASAIRSSAQAIGLAGGATQLALTHAQSRHLFGQTLADFEGTKEKFFVAWERISAARLLNLLAAARWDKGENVTLAANAALNLALTVAQEVTDMAVQLHGGYGYFEEMKAAMAYRDAKMLELISPSISAILMESWIQLSTVTMW